MKPVTQYLTAVFELRPSRRKAAAMERVRSVAEGIRAELARDVAMMGLDLFGKCGWRTQNKMLER